MQVTVKLKKSFIRVSNKNRNRETKNSFKDLTLNFIPKLDEGNQALQEFLAARNPKQQHSSTLESYLIKPIQRILKYPLLLQQLRNLTDPRCEEHLHLVGTYIFSSLESKRKTKFFRLLQSSEALKGMEKVAEHINEMQRIHEEYGAIFDHLFRQHQKACKQPIDLSPGMSSG